MKICDLVQFYSPLSGGVKRYVRDKMRFIETQADLEHILIVPSYRDAVRREYGSRVYEICSPHLLGSRSYRALVAAGRIRAILEKERPDVIEVGDPYHAAWTGVRAGRELGVPVVAYYHSDYPRALGRTVRKYAGAAADGLVSAILERYLRAFYNRMAATVVATERFRRVLAEMGIERLVTMPLGTDTSLFRRRDSRGAVLRELGLAPDAVLLLYAGRLAREKNISALLDMMDHLARRNGPFHLALLGDGELLVPTARRARCRGDVTILPYSNSPLRLSEIYSAADLFVHAGTCETFGLVSLEAQACGTRVLAVRGGGLEETLAGERPLIMAERADGPSLAGAVIEARNLGEAEADRLARRQRIVEMFSTDRTYGRLVELYRTTSERYLAAPYGVGNLQAHDLCHQTVPAQ